MILFILIIIIIIWIYYSYDETFINNANIIYTNPSNILEDARYITWAQEKDYIIALSKNKPISYPRGDIKTISIVIDPLCNYLYLDNRGEDYNKGYFVCLSHQKPYQCTYDLQYKTIGYFTQSDLYFIKAILYGYRIDVSTVRLYQLNSSVMDLKAVNMALTFVVVGSKFYQSILNSNIYIYGFKDIDIHRVRLFYPFVDDYIIELKDMVKTINIKFLEQGKTNIPYMNLKIIRDVKNSYVFENFISRLEISPEIFDPDYTCFGMTDIENRALCNSQYDELGNVKDFTSIWDKQCKEDSDCPFYRSNKNYPNNRGGCISGFCEFPVGIQRIGYRKYNDKYPYTPFCYNSFDCKTNPDYAFPNDQSDRSMHQKEIIIHRM